MNIALLYDKLGIYFQKNQNPNSMLLNDMKIPTRAISSVLSLNLYIYATYFYIEFCQVLLTLVEKVIMPPKSRSRTPTNKIVDSYIESCAQHAFLRLQNNYSSQFIIMSLYPKFHMPRRKIWAMLKKERKSMPRGMRKKWTCVQQIKQWVLRCSPKKIKK
jgi:hypothetical protein